MMRQTELAELKIMAESEAVRLTIRRLQAEGDRPPSADVKDNT